MTTGGSGGNYIYTYGGDNGYTGGTYVDPSGSGNEYDVPIIPAPIAIILNQSNAIIQLLNDANDVDFIVNRADLTENTSGKTSTARTIDPNTGKFQVTITFDNNYLNTATRLSIARTMIQETIHAFIVYNLFASPDSEFLLELYSYGANKGYSGQELHHNFMQQYLEAIGYSLAIWNSNYGNAQDIPRSILMN